MKVFAILSVLVLIATLVFVGWMYMTANVVVEATGVTAVEAESQPQLFAELQEQMRLGAVVGTAFTSTGELGKAEDYQFYAYTIRLRNDCAVAAELIELQVTPMAGDVLQLGTNADLVLPAHATGDITATILTRRDMHPIREVTVTYYGWGAPFGVKTTVR